jgi:hypothetical protein
MATKGDALRFRGVSGLVYPATLAAMFPTGRCSIEVDVGTKETFPLTMVHWYERDTGEPFTAWPATGEVDGQAERQG